MVVACLLIGALAGCAKSVPELVENAKNQHAKSEFDAAIVSLKAALQQEPDNGYVRFLIGSYYNETFDGELAQKDLERAKALGVVEGGRVALELARALRLQKKHQELLKSVTPSEAFEPEIQATILAWRGASQFAVGQLDEAKNSLSLAEKTGISVPAVPLLQAQLKIAERDIDGAEQLVEEASKRFPKSFDVWSFRADLGEVRQRVDQRMGSYQKMLEIYPRHLGALVGRSTLLIGQGKLDEAQKDIDVLKKRYRFQPATHTQVAMLLVARGQYREALEGIQLLLKSNPNYVPALMLGGICHLALNAPAQAERMLSAVVAANPRNLVARRYLASALVKLDKGQRALEVVEPILRSNSNDPAVFEITGDAYASRGEYLRANEWFKRATSLDPKNVSDIFFKIGAMNFSAGQLDEAIEVLEKGSASGTNQGRNAALLIKAHLAKKDYKAALDTADAYSKKAPKDPRALYNKAVVLMTMGEMAKGTSELEAVLKLDAKFFPAIANLAQIDIAKGNPDSARKRYEQLLEKDARHFNAMLALAQLHESQGRKADAIKMLELAASTSREALQPRVHLVRLLLDSGEVQRAASVAEEASAANPEHPVALELVGGTQMARREYANAVTTFAKLAALYPNAGGAFYSLAQAQLAQGRTTEARGHVEKAIRLSPNDLRAQKLLIDILMREGQAEQALGVARKLQQTNPKSPGGHVYEGDIHRQRGMPREAAAAYDRALAIVPMGDIAIKRYGAMAAAGDANRAIESLAGWVDKYPGNSVARFTLAGLLSVRGDYATAVKHYESLLKDLPEDASVLNGLAWAYFSVNPADPRARDMLDKAIKLAPNDPLVGDTAGWMEFKRGNVSKAREYIEKAAKLAPDLPEIRYHFGAVLAREGNVVQARTELDAALKGNRKFAGRGEAEALRKSLGGG